MPRSLGGVQFNLVAEVGASFDQDHITLQFFGSERDDPGISVSVPLYQRWTQFDLQPSPGGASNESWRDSWSAQATISTLHTGWRIHCQQLLAQYYSIVWAGTVIGSLLLGAILGLPREQIRLWLGLILAGWFLIIGRTLFYTLVEVWMRWGIGRYVAPQTLLAVWVILLSAFFLGAVLRVIGKSTLQRRVRLRDMANE
jgi:hypothetical protein